MPRRGMPNIPMFTAGMAKATGAGGFGLAEAGNQMYKLGQGKITDKLNQDRLDERVSNNAFNQDMSKKRLGLSYASNARANTAHNLAMKKHALDNSANELAGMDYANTHPNDPMLQGGKTVGELGAYIRGNTKAKTGSPYATVKTDQGIILMDKRDGSMTPTQYKSPIKQETESARQLREMRERKERKEGVAQAEGTYGDSWNDYTPEEKDYVLGQYNQGYGLPKNIDEWGWGRHRPSGYKAPNQPAQDNARLNQLQKMLEQQNKLLEQ